MKYPVSHKCASAQFICFLHVLHAHIEPDNGVAISSKHFSTLSIAARTVTCVRSAKIKWLDQPEGRDYPTAASYLNLLFDDRRTKQLVAALKAAPVAEFKSKDIFRAARLPLLSKDNSHVAKDRQKIRAGEKLSPVLLVRDSVNGQVMIADGYHRLCAVYSLDEDAVVPCKIA